MKNVYWQGLALAAAMLSAGQSQAAAVLHSDDFNTAAHGYSVVFGAPALSAATGPFGSQSLAFNSAGNSPQFYYDQISYPVWGDPEISQTYRVSFDMFGRSLVGSTSHFTVFLDTPEVRALSFDGDGYIRSFNPGSRSLGIAERYSNEQLMHVDMLFDLAANLWQIDINGNRIYSDVINASGLESIRFSHGGSADFAATTYLDNVNISQVPLPGAGGLLGVALSGMLLARRARRS